MSIAAVKIRILPMSPDIDLTIIEKEVTKILEREGVKNPGYEIQEVAFGLKAVIVLFGWPEGKDLEALEDEINKLELVSSTEVIDIRRAIG